MNLDKTLASAVVAAAMLSLSPLVADAQGNGGRERGGGRATAGQPAQRNEGGRQAAVRQAPRRSRSAGRAGAHVQRPADCAPDLRVAAGSGCPPVVRVAAGASRQRQPGVRRSAGSAHVRRAAGPGSVVRVVAGASRQRQPGVRARRRLAPTAARRMGRRRRLAPAATRRMGRRRLRAVTSNRAYGSQPAPRQAVPRPPSSYGYRAPAYGPNGRGYYNGGSYYGRYYARPYYGNVYVRPYGWAPYRPYYFARRTTRSGRGSASGSGCRLGIRCRIPTRISAPIGRGSTATTTEPHPTASARRSRSTAALSFDIQPSDADVFVDGEYVGHGRDVHAVRRTADADARTAPDRGAARGLPRDGVGRDGRARPGDPVPRGDAAVLTLRWMRVARGLSGPRTVGRPRAALLLVTCALFGR